MANKLFVGNISWGASDADLKELFTQYGEVEEAVIIINRATGRSKGFGFVTFTNEADAAKAIEALDGYELDGRPLAVSEAKPPKPREF